MGRRGLPCSAWLRRGLSPHLRAGSGGGKDSGRPQTPLTFDLKAFTSLSPTSLLKGLPKVLRA